MHLHYLRLIVLIFCGLFSFKGVSQVGINTSSPSPASVLDVNSSIDGTHFGGFMPPKVTLSQRNNISTSPSDDGLMVFLYEGNNRCLQIFDAIESVWENVYCMPVNEAPVASNVQIAGTYQQNETLTASFTYTDTEGDAAGVHTYTWLRATDSGGSGQVVLQSGTSNTYNLTAAHLGFYIAVEVVPKATTGTSPGSPVSSAFGGPVIAPVTGASDLFISEYVEGSGYNKAIEVANFTGGPINLVNYKIEGYQNGSTTANYTYSFPNVTLANGDVYVIAHTSWGLSTANIDAYYNNFQFAGNDPVALVNSALQKIDVVGLIGSTATFGSETTLRKKPGIGPKIIFDATDYTGFPQNTINGLGSHTF